MVCAYKKIEELFEKNHTNASRVGKETNINPVVFSDWKSGKSKPKIDKLAVIAKHFGIPLEELLEE